MKNVQKRSPVGEKIDSEALLQADRNWEEERGDRPVATINIEMMNQKIWQN